MIRLTGFLCTSSTSNSKSTATDTVTVLLLTLFLLLILLEVFQKKCISVPIAAITFFY